MHSGVGTAATDQIRAPETVVRGTGEHSERVDAAGSVGLRLELELEPGVVMLLPC